MPLLARLSLVACVALLGCERRVEVAVTLPPDAERVTVYAERSCDEALDAFRRSDPASFRGAPSELRLSVDPSGEPRLFAVIAYTARGCAVERIGCAEVTVPPPAGANPAVTLFEVDQPLCDPGCGDGCDGVDAGTDAGTDAGPPELECEGRSENDPCPGGEGVCCRGPREELACFESVEICSCREGGEPGQRCLTASFDVGLCQDGECFANEPIDAGVPDAGSCLCRPPFECDSCVLSIPVEPADRPVVLLYQLDARPPWETETRPLIDTADGSHTFEDPSPPSDPVRLCVREPDCGETESCPCVDAQEVPELAFGAVLNEASGDYDSSLLFVWASRLVEPQELGSEPFGNYELQMHFPEEIPAGWSLWTIDGAESIARPADPFVTARPAGAQLPLAQR